MASLTDLFNPNFLIFLGILVIVVALLVVYFETTSSVDPLFPNI